MKTNSFKENFELLNKHLQRHALLMIIASSIVSLIALLYTIYWVYDPIHISETVDAIYLGGGIFFLVISILLTGVLILFKKIKFKTHALAIIIHIYVFLLVTWSTLMCVLELKYGYNPVSYFMIFTLIAGLFVVEPLFFGVTITASVIVVISTALSNGAAFFNEVEGLGNLIDFIVYFVIILLVGGEHYGIVLNDHRIEKKLERLTYYDDLTGLLNERSYLKEIDELDASNEEDKKYIVVLMDLNNLKTTNDKYGHRYGCHLVVRCGYTLPQYFKSSKLFHIGGDEYVVIVEGEDYDHFDSIYKKFDEELSYSLVEYEGQELIFSLAHGYAYYEKGLLYKDVMQKADDAMYENKKYLKDKYKMKSR